MKNRMFYFLLGFMCMWLIAIGILSYNPSHKTDIVCGGCGSQQWFSIIAEGE